MIRPRAKVSVIVPCYNSELYLGDTIDSILANRCDGFDLELIAVNDCSCDGTLEILRRYAGSIRIIDKQSNQGACRARNDGIRAATGEFIALCDHDDLWEPDKLRLQLEKFQDARVGLVCSDADSFDQHGVVTASMAAQRPLRRGQVFRELLHANFVVQSSAVVRRAVFDEVGLLAEDIFPAEDLDLWLRIAQHWQVDYVDRILVHYRISSTMYSRDKIRMKQARLPVISRHAKELHSEKEERAVLADALAEFAMDFWYDRRFGEARGKLKEALRYRKSAKCCSYLLLTYLPEPLLYCLLSAVSWGRAGRSGR